MNSTRPPENTPPPENLNSPEDKDHLAKLQQESEETLEKSRILKDEIIQELEQDEKLTEKEGVRALIETEFPHGNHDWWDSPEFTELKKTFEPLDTTYLSYPVSQRFLPWLVSKLENSRLGENPLYDALSLPVSWIDSIASVAMLSGHFIIDAWKLLLNPREEHERTKSMMS